MFDDKALGGHSHGTQQCAAGILSVAGELAPNRGSPAFITVPLLLSTDGTAQDLSAYQGVRVKLKVTKGNIYVQVGSSAITNFDYHTSEVIGRSPEGFREIRIPFTAMKRAWSEQVPLDRKTVTSVNLVAVGMAKDQFAYEVDEVGLY